MAVRRPIVRIAGKLRQWVSGDKLPVEVLPVGTTAGTVCAGDDTRIGAGSSRNKIINGKMEIAQRGTSGTSANTYCVDRWIMFHAGTAPTWARVSGGVLGGEYFSSLIVIAGANGNTGINLNQRIESLNSADLCGKTVTFSAYVLHTNTGGPRNFVITAQRPNTADNWSGVTSIGNSGNISVPLNIWTRITWTTTLPASGPNLGLSFEILCGALAAAQEVYVTGVQLEVGEVATPFEHRPYGTELVLCQRYYQTFFRPVLRGSSTATQLNRIGTVLPVQMRASPTASFSGTHYWADGFATGTFTSAALVATDTTSVEFDATPSTGSPSAGRASLTYKSPSSTGVLNLSAEL